MRANSKFGLNEGDVQEISENAATHHGTNGVTDHLALLYEDCNEQLNTAAAFLKQGLERDERCLYVVNDNPRDTVVNAFRKHGINIETALDSGALSIHKAEEIYQGAGGFDRNAMFGFWRESLSDAKEASYTKIRAATEMTWMLDSETTPKQLTTYEALLNPLYAGEDYIVMCQYNQNRFPPEIISDIIRTHPLLVHEGTVSQNGYYQPPDAFLTADQPILDLDQVVRQLQTGAEDDVATESADSDGIGKHAESLHRPSTVLIVGDKRELMELYSPWLEGTPTVQTVSDTETALERLDDTVALVVVDRKCLARSRDEILARLREDDHNCRVVIATAHAPSIHDIEKKPDEHRVNPVQRDDQVLKASLDEVLLGLLLRRNGGHGKELLGDLREMGCDISPGTLYPRLRELHEEGILKQRERVRTKQYSINDPKQAATRITNRIVDYAILIELLESSLAELDPD